MRRFISLQDGLLLPSGGSSSSSVAEYSTLNLKVDGSSLARTAGTGKGNDKVILLKVNF
jgi:hypothetical protein